MKSSTMSVLNEDYVNVAEARGLKDRRISTAYIGRNASLPALHTVDYRRWFCTSQRCNH